MKENNYYIELERKGYFETIDKRSKEYRDYKEWKNSTQRSPLLKEKVKNEKIDLEYEEIKKGYQDKNIIGAGDVIETITKYTGIKKVVELVSGEECGCDERKKKFNERKSWKRKNINCITKEDYKWTVDNNIKKKSKWKREEIVRLVNIYNHVFKTKIKPTSCSSCVKSYTTKLLQYLEIYSS
jgi:hypothetical protein